MLDIAPLALLMLLLLQLTLSCPSVPLKSNTLSNSIGVALRLCAAPPSASFSLTPLKLQLATDEGSMRARPLLHGMLFTISAARRLGVGQSSDSADAESLQSDVASFPLSDDFSALLSAYTVLVIRLRRALMRATSAAMRSSPLGMPGDATERAEEAVLGLGVLLRTTDCSAAANAGDDMSGGDLMGADEAGDNRIEGGGGGGGGAVRGEDGLTEDGDRTAPTGSALCKLETTVPAPASSANAWVQ